MHTSTTKRRSALVSHVVARGLSSSSSGPISMKLSYPTPDAPGPPCSQSTVGHGVVPLSTRCGLRYSHQNMCASAISQKNLFFETRIGGRNNGSEKMSLNYLAGLGRSPTPPSRPACRRRGRPRTGRTRRRTAGGAATSPLPLIFAVLCSGGLVVWCPSKR
jgi:hypothetical protein